MFITTTKLIKCFVRDLMKAEKMLVVATAVVLFCAGNKYCVFLNYSNEINDVDFTEVLTIHVGMLPE